MVAGSLDSFACRVVSDGLVDYIEVPGVGVFDVRDCDRGLPVDDERKLVYGFIGEGIRCVFEEFMRAAKEAVGIGREEFVRRFEEKWELMRDFRSRKRAEYFGKICGVRCSIRLAERRWLVDSEEVKYVRMDAVFVVCGVRFTLSFTGRRIYWVWDRFEREFEERGLSGFYGCLCREHGHEECCRLAGMLDLFP